MGDSWEDFDDDDVKLPGAAVAPAAWDDEEEEDEIETVAAPQQSSAKAAAARPGVRIRAAADAPPRASERQRRLGRGPESPRPPSRAARRTRPVPQEPAEVDPNMVSIKLEDLKDHLKLFLKVNDAKFTSADLADLIILLTNNKKAKDLLIEKPTESNKTKKSKKKSKKEQLEQNKKHADLFGEAEAGEYDNYEDQYDDFF
ncbi:alpha-methylacyl-CoA racemase [Aureococcus anophagefferens]|nr:alpha-methylacyl-CoA racemase [Aureococcus anophagefferens]